MAKQEGTTLENDNERKDYTIKAISQILDEADRAGRLSTEEYMTKYGDERDKDFYENVLQRYRGLDLNSDSRRGNRTIKDDILADLTEYGFNGDRKAAAGYLKDLDNRVKAQRVSGVDSTMGLLTDYEKYSTSSTTETPETPETPATEPSGTEDEAANDNAESEDDFIEFSYKPGDTFGQKILDLGIGTDNGLWGDNGDVAFYTKQLIDGDYLDANGNVKLGVPIRLKRRK